jgi:hypothetical protein
MMLLLLMMMMVMVVRPVKLTRGHIEGPEAPHRLLALSPGRVCVVVGGLDQVLLVL